MSAGAEAVGNFNREAFRDAGNPVDLGGKIDRYHVRGLAGSNVRKAKRRGSDQCEQAGDQPLMSHRPNLPSPSDGSACLGLLPVKICWLRRTSAARAIAGG